MTIGKNHHLQFQPRFDLIPRPDRPREGEADPQPVCSIVAVLDLRSRPRGLLWETVERPRGRIRPL